MQDFYNESLTVLYHHGSRIALNSAWRDKNVICPNSKIYYVLDGEICVELKNRSIIARRGDIVLIPAGTKHSYHLTELSYAEKYWFHFDFRCGQKNYFDSVDFPYIRNIGVTKRITDLFDTVVYTKNNTPSNRINISLSLMSIVSVCLEGCGYTDTPPRENDETDKVITYIKKNYNEKITLEELSKMAKLSPNYFIKRFKEKLGYSPIKYINILRIERAKFLLEHTEKPINEIMEDVGFWDSAHFSKLFKSETGYSPTKFRRALASRKSI
ncbi:MAG: helix-turn-helix domain-containing protein [Ruminococcaceae bacterium]|nr:helix-turn-helix domain-containing protein [Oscillospiraceae bacterium]